MKKTKPMWVAVNSRGVVHATWYRGCVQPFRGWRKAIKSLGYTAIRASVTFRSTHYARG